MSVEKPTLDEQIEALTILRNFARIFAREGSDRVAQAIHTLDNADVFAELDQAALEIEQDGAERIPVTIVKIGPLYQAFDAKDHIWTTATTHKKAEENLTERSEMFLIVTPEELRAITVPEQTYDTPRCKHCVTWLEGNDMTERSARKEAERIRDSIGAHYYAKGFADGQRSGPPATSLNDLISEEK